jgi:hypothetical protein
MSFSSPLSSYRSFKPDSASQRLAVFISAGQYEGYLMLVYETAVIARHNKIYLDVFIATELPFTLPAGIVLNSL